MSEERFERLELKLDTVVADVAVLKTDVAVLKTDVAVLKTDVAVLKTDVAVLKTDVGVLKADVGGLKTDVGGLHHKVDTLGREMRVLYEDTIDRIRATDRTDLLRMEMRAGFDEILRKLAEHAGPGEAADRHFATVLDNHEQRIRTLENR